MTRPAVMWFRRDLRLADNRALSATLAHETYALCAFAEAVGTPHGPGRASRGWRRESIESLARAVDQRGGSLQIVEGRPASELPRLARGLGAATVYCSRDWAPEAMAEEASVREGLERVGVTLVATGGQLLVEPDVMATSSSRPFGVFTPYHRAWLARSSADRPTPAPDRLSGSVPTGLAPARVEPDGSVPDELTRLFEVGESGAQRALSRFVSGPLADYPHTHDLPSVAGTSMLSPHLAHGELSPGQVVAAARAANAASSEAFVRQLAWREFAYHVLHHYPHTADEPMRPEFVRFPWRDDEALTEQWQEGRTGYPFVDAGMRQLTATGWMHNRVRMVAGSLLTKDLLVPWQVGEHWFRDRLVDYDPALNAFNWQWVAGSGADAAPFFRVFNPRLQAARFDPDGAYARQWIAEFETASYPQPIVDHADARARALAAYKAARS